MALATLALAAFSAMDVIWWLVVGLVAGALASFIMRGGGYGIVGDIIVGIIGAFIGGFLMSLVGAPAGGSTLWTIIVAIIGACVLIAIVRAVSGGTRRAL